ncbi:MAG: HlyD family efflux transporter periplasmic adaptor subunit, partial [Polyangiaceae bacterium]|nr:HlyD family efflux transporter periplasmic adaptor subunit [Polyangiaceae bacterium]
AVGPALALREPHLRSAKAALEGASAGLQRAKLSLSRTQIIAPFNAFVQSESVDIGQIVNAAMQLGRLVGTDAFWVQVSVPVEKLSWIRIPGLNAKEGSQVRVWQDVGDGQVERVGKVIRLFGDLDPVGRMARVLVEIPNPLESSTHDAATPKTSASPAANRDGAWGPKPSSLPLLVGAFVNVRIDAGQLDNVVEVPRSAIRDGDKVYVVDDEGSLRTKQLSVAWRLENSVLVSSGVRSGDRVIISQLATPLEGMKVRIIDNDATAKAEAK